MLVVVPERLADDVRHLLPEATTHPDVAGGDQALLLRIAIACRRGRVVNGRLDELGVTMQWPHTTANVRSGSNVCLTTIEFRLLRAIVAGGGETVSRARLVRAAWTHRHSVPAATLDSHIRRIRSKLAAGGIPLRIRTVRGVGFTLA